MSLHQSAFEYLDDPNDKQKAAMAKVCTLFTDIVAQLDPLIPDGPDKTYLFRQMRDSAMWANVAIMRNADGSPRT